MPTPSSVRTGEAQARAAAAAVALRGPVDAVVSSPLRRARQTADVVAAELGLPVREVETLRECAFGEWEGLTFAEVQERWPDELSGWLADTSVAPPGGESFDAVAARVRRARDQLLARHPGRTVLAVSHVTPIKLLVREALTAPAVGAVPDGALPGVADRDRLVRRGRGVAAAVQRRRPPARFVGCHAL